MFFKEYYVKDKLSPFLVKQDQVDPYCSTEKEDYCLQTAALFPTTLEEVQKYIFGVTQ